MSKLVLLKRQAKIGSFVTLRLTRGEDITGQITEIDELHVCLNSEDKIVTIFEDILAGWEIHQDAEIEKIQMVDPVLKESITSTIDSKSIEYLAKIEATFSEKIKYAHLEPPELNFHFPEQEFPLNFQDEIRRVWVRAKNQYEYAKKNKELSKINIIISQTLYPLTEKYPESPSLYELIGNLYLRIESTTKASEAFWKATTISKNPKHWYALAFSASPESTLQYFAIKNYLCTNQEIDFTNVWFNYINLILKRSDFDGLKNIIDYWTERTTDISIKKLIAETVAYIFCKKGQKNDALKIVDKLLSSPQAAITEDWQQIWPTSNGIMPPELSELEQKFLKDSQSIQAIIIPESTKENNESKIYYTRKMGKITAFILEKSYGFIKSNDKICYFDLRGVISNELKQALLNNSWMSQPEVHFKLLPPSLGYKRPQAIEVEPAQRLEKIVQTPEEILKNARDLLSANQHGQAISLVRNIYKIYPNHKEAQQLESEIQNQIKTKGIGLPKGQGNYDKAKRAQLGNHDFQEAERLYKIAITENNDKTESAVKDLASLLQQQGRFDEAVTILKSNHKRFYKSITYNNTLATLYQHLGHYDDAIKTLRLLVEKDYNRTQPNLLRRIAVLYFKQGHYDQTEETLRELRKKYPEYQPAERLLSELEEAKRTGSYANAEEIFGILVEEGIELSPLAKDAIKNCTFEGVNPTKIQEKNLTIKDVEYLENLARKLGWQTPRERSAYYLSAAAILDKFIPEENTMRIHRDLRRYFSSMGDAAWMDKKSADVVRTYYLESLKLTPNRSDETEELLTLVHYFATFAPDHLKEFRDVFFQKNNHQNAVKKSLSTAHQIANNNDPNLWIHALLELCAQSLFATYAFLDSVVDNEDLRILIKKLIGLEEFTTNLEDQWRSYCKHYLNECRERNIVCKTLLRHQLTVASMEELIEKLRGIAKTPLWELDRRRITEISDIANYALAFCRASEFEEKEQQYWLVTTQAKHFIETIREAPTHFCYEAILPIAKHLQSLIEDEYAQIARTSAPNLELRLLADSYLRGQDGKVRLQIEILNQAGCSPASSVCVIVGPTDSPYFSASQLEWDFASTLRGSSSIVGQVHLSPSENALKEQVFPIKIQVRYRNRMGEACSTDEKQWTVRLYDEYEFKEVTNSYAPYSEGGPVDNPKMFVGRDDLLLRLENSLLAGSGSKSIVVFGQKRAGKSSLLEHLRRRLSNRLDCIPISMSLQDIAPDLSEAAFFYRILKGFEESFEELRLFGRPVPPFKCLRLEDLILHPSLSFHDSMSDLQRQWRRLEIKKIPTFVLLIDEFTDIYKQIRKQKIIPEFMKAWKSILEKRYFSSVLVGQDIMPAFKESFPNEFGVTEDIRITYLAEADAKRLIEEPVGIEHFAGKAISRILELTAGSPYYTMMLCSRLVDYMNKTRSAIVTEADIMAVEQGMLSGDRRLSKDKFDNLVAAGDGFIDSGIDPDRTLQLCLAIAKKSNRGWCKIDDAIDIFQRDELDSMLKDLVSRDVIEQKGDKYRIRVGLFHDWLLIQG